MKDAAGNRRTASTTVVVDRTGSALRWSRSFFPQDKDDIRATSTLKYSLSRDATTTLRLYDRAGNVVRTVWKGKAQAAGCEELDVERQARRRGLSPRRASYMAKLIVRSKYARLELTRWLWAAGFAITPSSTTVKAGRTLTVTFTPIEPLSTKPVVTFTQPGKAGVQVTATKRADGSYKAAFTVKSGPAGTAAVKVSAKDADGRTNSTTISIKVAS